MAHKRLRGKCCQGHLKGMNIQKIRILTLICPHLKLIEVITITSHSTQILNEMCLFHYSDLVMVLDVRSDWGLVAQGTCHYTATIYSEPFSRVQNKWNGQFGISFPCLLELRFDVWHLLFSHFDSIYWFTLIFIIMLHTKWWD